MSNLRKQQGFNAIPCRLGEINKETKFVLDKLGVKSPKLLKTVSAQITDLNYVEKSTISTEDFNQRSIRLNDKRKFLKFTSYRYRRIFQNYVKYFRYSKYLFRNRLFRFI